jgi:NTP pyrophosphatase (non-canonical NTP hydrolase)
VDRPTEEEWPKPDGRLESILTEIHYEVAAYNDSVRDNKGLRKVNDKDLLDNQVTTADMLIDVFYIHNLHKADNAKELFSIFRQMIHFVMQRKLVPSNELRKILKQVEYQYQLDQKLKEEDNNATV